MQARVSHTKWTFPLLGRSAWMKDYGISDMVFQSQVMESGSSICYVAISERNESSVLQTPVNKRRVRVKGFSHEKRCELFWVSLNMLTTSLVKGEKGMCLNKTSPTL